MWDSKLIASKLKSLDLDDLLEPHFIHLALFDPQNQVGIGTDGQGNTVLVLPGQDDVTYFHTQFASYDPWSNLVVFETKDQLNGVSILRCDIDLTDDSTLKAASAVFSGLLDLQDHFGKTGKAIWRLKSLFANRMRFELSDSVITGFLGELLIVYSAEKPNIALGFWHSNADAKYDFSGSNFRLEVKATTSRNRHHNFSSYQIPGDVPEKTIVASVLISKVERGNSLLDVFSELKLVLNSQEYVEITDLAFEVLGVPVELITDYQFDLLSSLESIKLVNSSLIPRPEKNDGVISMEWLANLDSISFLDAFDKRFFERN